MFEQARSTATQRVNQNENRGSSVDIDFTLENLVRNANDVVNLTIPVRANAAPVATGAAKPEAKGATLPDFIDQERVAENLSQIVNLSPAAGGQSRSTLHALQEWEGYVVAISDTDFLARLADLTAGSSYEEEEVDIPLDEISDYDAARIRVGSIFRWVIGYERSATGTKRRVSQIVFRDLPAMTKADLREGEAWAHEVTRSLNL